MAFIDEYFINPIVEKSGYNIVNTTVYAVIAIVACYVIFKFLKNRFDKKTFLYLIPFILFGSTLRAIADFLESREKYDFFLKPIIESGIYNYSFYTVTPGIYILIAAIVLLLLVIDKRKAFLKWVGIFLFLFHFVLLAPTFKNFGFLAVIVALTILFFAVCYAVLRRAKISSFESKVCILSHLLDGCASFTAIDIINQSEMCQVFGKCYFAQHVIERALSTVPYGLLIFIVVKATVVMAACYFIERIKDENEKYFLYSIILTLGLAPGFRNTLRIVAGV
jgi:uncharacterized membrane protein